MCVPHLDTHTNTNSKNEAEEREKQRQIHEMSLIGAKIYLSSNKNDFFYMIVCITSFTVFIFLLMHEISIVSVTVYSLSQYIKSMSQKQFKKKK